MNRHTPRPERNATTRWCGLAGALALLGAGLLFLDTGGVLPLDDAWIHLAFAKHLAESGQWGLLAGQPSGGETSPGYPLLLTLAELGPFSLGAAWALALGTLSYALLPWLVWRLVPVRWRDRRSALWLGACVALGGPLLFHALSGMETVPYLALGLFALGDFSEGRMRRAGCWAGAAMWMRPDAWALWLALGIGLLHAERCRGSSWGGALNKGLRDFLPGLLIGGAAVLGLGLVQGSWVSTTLAGRRWLTGLDPQWSFDAVGQGAMPMLRDWLRALSAQFGYGHFAADYFPDHVALRVLRYVWNLGAAALLTLGLWRAVREMRLVARDGALHVFAAWGLWTLLQYCVLLPSRGHAGRYQPQLLLGFLLLVALAGARLWPRPWARPLLVLVLGGVLLSGYDALRYARAASAHIAHVHRRASIELADEVGEGARVAAFDIGVLAYDAPVALLDVSGLSSRETVEAIAAHRLPLWLARHNATHVLLPVTNDDGRNSLRARLGLAEADNFSLARVAGWESLDERWRPAFRYSGNAARGLWLYEIRRTPAAGFPE